MWRSGRWTATTIDKIHRLSWIDTLRRLAIHHLALILHLLNLHHGLFRLHKVRGKFRGNRQVFFFKSLQGPLLCCSLTQILFDCFIKNGILFFIHVNGKINSKRFVGNRNPCCFELQKELPLLRLIPQVKGSKTDFRYKKNVFLNLFNLTSFRIFPQNTFSDVLFLSIDFLVVIVALNFRNNLHTLLHVSFNMLLEISHHLCDKFTVQSTRSIGTTGRTGNKRLTNTPRLQKLLSDALKVLIKTRNRLTAKNRFNIKPKVVNEHPKIGRKCLLHQVTNIIEFFLSRNPRHTRAINILNPQIAKDKR